MVFKYLTYFCVYVNATSTPLQKNDIRVQSRALAAIGHAIADILPCQNGLGIAEQFRLPRDYLALVLNRLRDLVRKAPKNLFARKLLVARVRWDALPTLPVLITSFA
jgi:hypothetical protein